MLAFYENIIKGYLSSKFKFATQYWKIVALIILSLIFTQSAKGQSFKSYDTENGLSDRRVYSITQDPTGFIWLLTENGIDRFDGVRFKHYPIELKELLPAFLHQENALKIDKKGTVWHISSQGLMHRYDSRSDTFQEIDLRRGKENQTYSLINIDNNNQLWTGNAEGINIYDIKTRRSRLLLPLGKGQISPTCQTAIDEYNSFVGSDNGVFLLNIQDGQYRIKKIIAYQKNINQLYYNAPTRQLVFTSITGELFCYTPADKNHTEKIQHICTRPNLVTQCIIKSTAKPNQLLIATNGEGIFSLDLPQGKLKHYIHADYALENKLPGDNITALHMDKQRHIWMASYPNGIYMMSLNYPSYKWYRHYIGNDQSICNNHVNDVIEDSDGDLWFATANGVSFYSLKKNHWEQLLTKQTRPDIHSNVFLSLREAQPGIIVTAGYLSGAYWIRKSDLSTHYISPATHNNRKAPNRFIRSIFTDAHGNVWTGGYFNLVRTNWKRQQKHLYNFKSSITCIEQRDNVSLWVGTTNGLYNVSTENANIKHSVKALEHQYITAVCKVNENTLYIGTNGNGLYIIQERKLIHYNTKNSALQSNNIYAIIQDPNGDIVCSTEMGLTRYVPNLMTFYNWSGSQGLNTYRFNIGSGIHTSRKTFVFGGCNGAIEISDTVHLPRKYKIRLFFDDLSIYGIPESIAEQEYLFCKFKQNKLRLNAENNNFTLKIGIINFDNPDCIHYQWKLDGVDKEWTALTDIKTIHYTQLTPNHYTLHVRAVNTENGEIADERSLKFQVEQYWYKSYWMFIVYCLCIFVICYITNKHITLQKEQKKNKKKSDFFLQITHDIRTPLTLIKAPLLLVLRNTLDSSIKHLIKTAVDASENLMTLANELLQMEREQSYTPKLHTELTDLNDFMHCCITPLICGEDKKHIHFSLKLLEQSCTIWIDRKKINCIMQNLITNAIKYTGENGTVEISVWKDERKLYMRVKDNGCGISPKDQKRIFKSFDRGHAKESKDSFGLGLFLVKKLVTLHKGKLHIESKENEGCSITISFPICEPKEPQEHIKKKTQEICKKERPTLMIVEDNHNLQQFLKNDLSDTYEIITAYDGTQALERMKETTPDIIVSDLMMTPMPGDKLCETIKSNVQTSHIPFILLTARTDAESIVHGFRSHADQYMVKPFNIDVLRANIKTILENRSLIYGGIQNNSKEQETTYNGSVLDLRFLHLLQETVYANISNQDFSVDSLCRPINMSRSSIFTKLKILCNLSPSEYIRLQRIEYAKQQLKNTTESITDIAYSCGFNDGKYFREVFKKYTYMSPSEFRSKNKKQ